MVDSVPIKPSLPIVEWLATFNQKGKIEQGKGERSCPSSLVTRLAYVEKMERRKKNNRLNLAHEVAGLASQQHQGKIDSSTSRSPIAAMPFQKALTPRNSICSFSSNRYNGIGVVGSNKS
nr:conserved hypothetical protein [Ipomoea trifida]